VIVVLCAFLALLAVPARAQSGSVRAEVDANKIGTDDTVTLSIVMEGDAASLEAGLPALRNLRVVSGPSTSSQISIVNGSMSRQKIYSYELRAERSGVAEIGAVAVQGHAPTNPITIEVASGSIRPAQKRQDPFGMDPFGGRDPFEDFFGRARRQPATQGKVFVEAAPTRTSVKVGEPILVTYYVYTQISLQGVEFAEAPQYPGFWTEEIQRSAGESLGQNTTVEGETYLRYPVLERLLFPTKAGLLVLPEARLRLVPVAGPFGVAASVERSTKAIRIQAEPLPKDVSDASAVGDYEVMSSVDRDKITMGEAFTYRFRVKGRGNLKWVDAAPKLAIDGLRIFAPKESSDLKTTRQGIEGSKTWEYVIVPEKEGSFRVPEVPFRFFDPTMGLSRTSTAEALDLEVTPAAGAPRQSVVRAAHGVSLRADLDAKRRDLVLPALGVAALALVANLYVLKARPASAKTGNRSAAGVAAALKALRDPAILDGTKERAASRIAEALETAFGARRTWPSDDRGDLLRTLADDLEFLRFAPQLGNYDEKLREVRDRAMALVEVA
jgi:hypothetical protein